MMPGKLVISVPGRLLKQGSVDHLVCLETTMRETFIKAVFFHLERACDATWKCGVGRDLGLEGGMPSFISGILWDRHFGVHLPDTMSTRGNQEQGVLIGSVLSIVLFSVRIANAVKGTGFGKSIEGAKLEARN